MAGPRVYTVHAAPGARPGEPDVVLVKEGFCWPAFLVPPAWALWHRLWWALAAWLTGAAAVAAAGPALGLAPAGEAALGLVYALLAAGTANDWRRHALARRGWRFQGVVTGADAIEAEARLLRTDWPAQWRARQRQPARPPLAGFETDALA